MRFSVSILFTLFLFCSQAQTVLKVYAKDLYKKPISFAVIKYDGFSSASDVNGFLRINQYKPGTKITIHKYGFSDTTVFALPQFSSSDTLILVVTLRLKPMILPEVSVSASSIAEINPLKADFVIAYEFHADHIVQLLSDGQLLVIDSDNKIKHRTKPVTGSKDLVKDTDGFIYLITEKKGYKLFFETASMEVKTLEVDYVTLDWNLKYCDETTENSLFIRRYKDNNQTVAFFASSRQNKNDVKMLKEIGDAHRSAAVQAYANETNALRFYLAGREESNPGGVMGDISVGELELYRKAEEMTSILENNYVLPSYSFFKKVEDRLYLFAHDIDSLFVYDLNWNQVDSKRIDYHHLKIWGKELIINEEKTRVYAKLIDHAKVLIAEVDVQSGALKSTSTGLETKFPTRLRIKGDKLYFMAKQKGESGYTVYSQKLR